MIKKGVFIFFLATMFGCGGGRETSVQQDSTAIDTLGLDGTLTDTTLSTPAPKTASRELRTFTGLYILGDEVNTFRNCSVSSEVYWVEDESKQLAEQYKKAKGYLSYPYESVVVEVEGYLKGKSDQGYASEYPNVLVVTKVKSATPKSFNTDCFLYEFIALGNEPFWSLEINPAERIIALKDVAAEKTYVFPYKPATVTTNAFVYESSNGQKELIRVLIHRKVCSDGMSDRKYNYSAQVTLNNKSFSGCAIKKGEKVATGQ
jgi:uncharacterized membrane protein